MENLILDVKISIAEKDQEVWWLFYKYFDDFKSYTRQYMSHYCQLFTRIIHMDHCTKYYYFNCLYINYPNIGIQEWYQNDQLHRDDKPAVTKLSGSEEWYQHGKRHRDDGPAVIRHDGQIWYKNGELHRDGGPAVIYSDGKQRWYQHGKLHRDDGSAVINNGMQEWYKKGIPIKAI